MSMFGRGPRVVAGVAIVAVGGLGLTACGSSSSMGSTSSGLPKTVKLVSITDTSGASAFAGQSRSKGVDLAVAEINDQHYLGDATVSVDNKDPGGVAAQAASFASQAVAQSDVSVILGPMNSAEAVATAPIVQAKAMPAVFTQAGSAGVLVGKYTFRVTAPQSTFYEKGLAYVQRQGYKQMAVIYNKEYPTTAELATKSIKDGAGSYGYTVTSEVGVGTSTVDYSAPVSQALAAKPDIVAVLLIGAANVTALKQLRQAGYTGMVLANEAAGANLLAPAGDAGKGVFWPTDFTAGQTDASSQKFVKAYQAKYNGEAPLNYAAEGYDAVWMIARALKAANSSSREEIQKGLEKVAASGFTGAEGPLTFDNRDLRVPGVVVEWDGSKEMPLSEG